MSSEQVSFEERRDGTSSRISHLLAARQRLLVRYSSAAGLEPYTTDKPVADVMREFLQVLVDYVAAAHFELYNRIEEQKERRRAVVDVAKRHRPRLTETTHQAVAFNDKYENFSDALADSLADDLSELGELLAARFELEDELFAAFLQH